MSLGGSTSHFFVLWSFSLVVLGIEPGDLSVLGKEALCHSAVHLPCGQSSTHLSPRPCLLYDFEASL